MIAGIGIDIVHVARVQSILQRHGDRFLQRCFAADEPVRPHDATHLAGLLAAKEAAFKALGTGWGEGVGWRQVQVRRDPAGAPRLELSGTAASRAAGRGVRVLHLTISHDAGLAVAVVILEA